MNEKIDERFGRTIVRGMGTTTIITAVLGWSHILPAPAALPVDAFEVLWTMVFSIVFVGHWLEMLFVNYLKLQMPEATLPMLYLTRIVYWYLSAIPLFILAGWIRHLMTARPLYVGGWYLVGFFYIGLQLFMQAVIHIRRKKSFYNGVY